MLFKTEITKIKTIVNKFINIVEDKIDCLNVDSLQGQIKSEKAIVDLLHKLAKLTIDISKLHLVEDDENCQSDVDQNIIEQFYRTYKIEQINDNQKQSSSSNPQK